MAKFVLTGNLEGKTIALGNGRYQFVKGEMPCEDHEAVKINRILGRFYGAKMFLSAPSKAEADNVSSVEDEANKLSQPTMVTPSAAQKLAAKAK